MTNSRPPTPQTDSDMKVAVDWYTWGFQSGIEAEKKMAERRDKSEHRGTEA